MYVGYSGEKHNYLQVVEEKVVDLRKAHEILSKFWYEVLEF
jgi:hypothetical protein